MIRADEVYLDLMDFFHSESKMEYLINIVHPQDILDLLDDLENFFNYNEQYEKVSRIKKWRDMMSKHVPPHLFSNHLY